MDINFVEYHREWHADLLEGISDKFRAITENLESIEDYSGTGNCPFNKDNVTSVEVDFSCAYDEFLVRGNFENGSRVHTYRKELDSWEEESLRTFTVEVVTREVAESNDLDFLDGEEDESEYVLGGELSSYSPLGNSGYWYRLM